MRRPLEPASLEEVAGFVVSEPVRLVFKNPLRGGFRLKDIRDAVRTKGIVRLSGTMHHVFADIDPGTPEEPLVALDGIVRSDAKGIERAILSALPHVDEIVIGVDDRSDDETRKVVEAYADTPWRFGAADIGLSEEDWKADRIHFSNARNLGRSKVQAPWSFFLDSDEFIQRTEPVRERMRALPPNVGALLVNVQVEGYEQTDCQRIARSGFRWHSPSHNQLVALGSAAPLDMKIVHDPSPRSPQEQARRDAQRADGVNLLAEAAEQGDMIALFHLAKQKLPYDESFDEGVTLAEDFRKQTAVHAEGADHRQWIALAAASAFYRREKFEAAEVWCLRVLQDGPRLEAFYILADIAEDQGRLEDALNWLEIACVTPITNGMVVRPLVEQRWGRREALRRVLNRKPPDAYPGIPGLELPAGQDQADTQSGETEADTDGTNGAAASSASERASAEAGANPT